MIEKFIENQEAEVKLSDREDWEFDEKVREDIVTQFAKDIGLFEEIQEGIERSMFQKFLDFDFQRVPSLKLGLLVEWMKWQYVDMWRNEPERPFGTYLYVGLYGQGKTQSMIEHVYRCKKRFHRLDKLHIFSNFGLKGQDGKLDGIDDIMNAPENSLILLDEVSNLFNSRNWTKFPPEVIALLTMQRKFGKSVICSAQLFEHVDKYFRDLCQYVVQCNAIMGNRLFINKYYHGHEYESKKLDGALKSIGFPRIFVATDKHRHSYDTMEIIKQLKEAQPRELERGSSKDILKMKLELKK